MNQGQGFYQPQNQQMCYYPYPMQQQVIQPSKMKICKNTKGSHVPSCGVSKPIEEFYSGKSVCKDCYKQYTKSNSDKKKQELQLVSNQLTVSHQEIETIKLRDETKIKEMEDRMSQLLSTDENEIDFLIQKLDTDLAEKEKLLKQRDDTIIQLTSQLQQLTFQLSTIQSSLQSVTIERDQFKHKNTDYSTRLLQMEQANRQLKEENTRLQQNINKFY